MKNSYLYKILVGHDFKWNSLLSLFLFSVSTLYAQVYPLTDPVNAGGWVLNTEVSDEFEATQLDETKWLVQGRDGVFQSNHRGRAPSQFSVNNFRLENGKLKLETRWEPDYPFSPLTDANGVKYENITTAAVITKKTFLYGYLEIKCKAADAEISSTFWGTGSNTELDFFEFFGDHRQTNKLWKDRELWWSIHDWTSAGGGRTTYTESHDLGFRVADAFHVYGFDWSADGLKIYIDGVLYRNVPKATINAYDDVTLQNGGNGANENYVVTKPLKLWLSQATFPWHGVPDSKADLELNSPIGQKDDGIVDYEIEYVRVWQKGNLSVDDKTFGKKESKIYPNPLNKATFANLYVSAIEGTHITIFNLLGKEVISIEKTQEPFPVSVSNLTPGVYLVEIQSGTTKETKKLIVN
ncbi:T9SS type A sorting domain-containing protein [Flavobacterium sp. UMI-01]|uniref:T9SS type A sorting domain-containing protein n=1 Tax=Flavobacterium sp. UMI-01 TaxID=1441053 RepID=UPI001C7D423A|nr:T9SS type A sorting domain-containing protein [Flavobacterium sp. UMI-01]GIZ08866.1 hypothetical protein FUMI01_15930 [Flavobacterium sp. UMI-01]